MKKSFIAIISIILFAFMFIACDSAYFLDRANLPEHNGKANDNKQNDDFLAGLNSASIFYNNTLSITPVRERERVSIQLHTNNIEEARNWSILTEKNGSANRTLVNERENEKYFEFLWVEEWNNIRHGLLSRVHRSDFFIPIFDTFNSFPQFDDFKGNYVVGIYNGDKSIDNIKKFIEYLWVQPLLMWDDIIETIIVEEEDIIKIFIQSQRHDTNGFNNKFIFDIKTRVLTFVERNWIEETRFAKVDFFEEYGLTLEFAGIWNDNMPSWGWELTPEGKRASICTIHISSANRLPPMEVTANIITENIRLENVPFRELYKNDQFGSIYPGRHWRDYRPAIGFRLENFERYIMEITVRINGKQQIITIGDKVGVTH